MAPSASEQPTGICQSASPHEESEGSAQANVSPLAVSAPPRVPHADPTRTADTLLSAPAPAQKGELELEDRLLTTQRKLERLEDRVQLLEERLKLGAPVRLPTATWWILFLVALAWLWQLAGRLRGP